MNDRIMIGEHQFHIPSLCAGGFRLAAAAVGTGKPYGNELMQAWFQGFTALLSESGGLTEKEAKEYLASLVADLLPYLSRGAVAPIWRIMRLFPALAVLRVA